MTTTRTRWRIITSKHGYLDFEIKDVKLDHPTPNTMVIRFYIFEGRQYKVGAILFSGTTLLPTNAVSPGFKPGPEPKPQDQPRAQGLGGEPGSSTGALR